MYPEDTIRAEFWFFVRKRAADPRTGVEAPIASETLVEIEGRAHTVDFWLTDDEVRSQWDKEGKNWERDQPKTYATVQEAMLAFLIDQVAYNGFPYGYPTWLRAVALILADALRNPDMLLVVVYDEQRDAGQREHKHRMTVSDTDWDCLNRDTFRYIKRTYPGEGESLVDLS